MTTCIHLHWLLPQLATGHSYFLPCLCMLLQPLVTFYSIAILLLWLHVLKHMINMYFSVIILPEVCSTQLGRGHNRYSCGQPLTETAERLGRLLFFVSENTMISIAS